MGKQTTKQLVVDPSYVGNVTGAVAAGDNVTVALGKIVNSIATSNGTGSGNMTVPSYSAMPFNLSAGNLAEVNQSGVIALAIGMGNNGTAYVNLTVATPPNIYTAHYNVVGGGAASANDRSSGGGGAQVLQGNLTVTTGTVLNITVGAGGLVNGDTPGIGANTTLANITALGSIYAGVLESPGVIGPGGYGNYTQNVGGAATQPNSTGYGARGGTGGAGVLWPWDGQLYGEGGGGSVDDNYGTTINVSSAIAGSAPSGNSTGQVAMGTPATAGAIGSGNGAGGGGGKSWVTHGTAANGSSGSVSLVIPVSKFTNITTGSPSVILNSSNSVYVVKWTTSGTYTP